MSQIDFIVVGAGISGLLCAKELSGLGVSVKILDKGRGVGGRMSTRYMSGARLDHGAQFFTVRDQMFQKYVDHWLSVGVAKEWFRHAPCDSNPQGYPRYCGVGGMNEIPKYLAEELDVQCSEQVIAVNYKAGNWQVTTQSETVYHARHLILTAPLPQSLALLDTSGLNYADDELEALRSLKYRRGLTTLAILNEPSGLPEDGFIQLEDSVVTWLADNQMKGISDVPCLTIQSTPEFADLHWDSPDSVRGQKMIEAIVDYLKSQVTDYVCHRWGYALSEGRYKQSYFYNPKLNLALAGDGFSGGRVEGAALSGIQLARQFDLS